MPGPNDLKVDVARALGVLALARDLAPGVLLAVSGGPDSLALLLAGASIGDRPIFAATVDHGLRPEAADEARHVAAFAAELGIPHATLVWRHDHIRGNLQGAAREARYRLLAAHARHIGAGAVLTAHHRGDQVETHLLLEARGASGAALAGMRPWRDLEPHVALVRPFLERDPAELAAVVRAAGWRAVDDPSNRDARFARVRLRASLDRLTEDRAMEHVVRAARERAEEDERLKTELQDVWASCRPPIGSGRGDLPVGALNVPRHVGELTDRFLSRALTAAGGNETPPPAAAVARLRERLREARRTTLGNCLVTRRAEGLLLTREPGRSRCPSALAGEDGAAWFDRRFLVATLSPGDEVWGVGTGTFHKRRRSPELFGHPARGTNGVCPDRIIIAAGDWTGRASRQVLAYETITWRLWADLPGPLPEPLTARPQIAAKAGSPVGKV